MSKKKIREMEYEINHYKPPKAIANAMRKLAEHGYGFSGHGTGFGEEDFGVTKQFGKDHYIYVALSTDGKKSRASYSLNDPELESQVGGSGQPATIVRQVIKIKNKKDFMKEFNAWLK